MVVGRQVPDISWPASWGTVGIEGTCMRKDTHYTLPSTQYEKDERIE